MIDILKKARQDHEMLPREIMAHRLAAEYHRHWHMALGGISTVLSTLVGSAVFTTLVRQLGVDGKHDIQFPLAVDQGIDWFYWLILLLSIIAPVLAALHTFMHHAEDAATHRASVEGYANVHRQLTIFLATYDDSNLSAEANAALKKYDEIMQAYNSVLGKSLTLTKTAYHRADKKLRKQPASSH